MYTLIDNDWKEILMKKIAVLLVCFASLLFLRGQAWAVAIDLNDFFADLTVTVALDGASAIMGEDTFFSPVLLSNDPGLGDLFVIIPGTDTWLFFDYAFVEPVGVGNDDEFGAFILNSTGFSSGPAYEFFTQDTGSGTVAFDLSGLVSEPFIGLQFQLAALPGDSGLTSTVTISNVKLAPIPEPATLLLVGSGLAGFWAARKKKQKM